MGHFRERETGRRSDRVRRRRAARARNFRSRARQARRGQPDARRVQSGELSVSFAMRKLCCWLIGFIAVWAPHPPLGAADKVRITVTNPNMSFLPSGVALKKGFFKDEGLDVEIIRMN